MKKIVYPDYKNCIANVPNSILKYYGVGLAGDSLPLLDAQMKKPYKNVVLLLLDGMGKYILEKHLADMQKECVALDGLVVRVYGKEETLADGKKWAPGTGNAWNKTFCCSHQSTRSRIKGSSFGKWIVIFCFREF